MRLLGNAGGRGGRAAWRDRVEWALRVVVIGVLAWYLGQVLRARAGNTAEVATSAELPRKLVRWSTVTAPARVHVALDYPPPAEARDWLAALGGAGAEVGWSGAALLPTAAALEPLADPAGGADLVVAAPEHAAVVLRDALGAFDTVTAGRGTVRIYLPSPPSAVEAAVGPVVATAPLRDSLTLHRLLLLGHAGWEAKFATAALEERGWKVDAMMALSPLGQGDVRQGRIGTIDTATYSAVLAIDTVATRYADQLARYVQSGGGLVLWPEATKDPRLAALAPGSPSGVLPDAGRVPVAAAPRSALALAPLEHLKADVLTLEQQNGRAAVAARRLGPGRVIQLGYLNSWRWRMAGVDGADLQAVDAHRDWLARLVASVAHTGRQERPAPTADAAPLATLVDQLGAASVPVQPGRDLARVGAWIFGLLMTAVLLEWASRRLRGVK